MNMHRYNFQKLTPRNDIELGVYENAIDYVFRNDDVCNVAVSGAYGAGKSSVIESYKKQHPWLKFMHISLAHFTEEGSGATKEGSGIAKEVRNIVKDDVDDANLEGKIINQLVHQISPEHIPQTRFTMKHKVDEDKIQSSAVRLILFLLLCGFLWFRDAWCELLEGLSWYPLKNMLSFSTKRETQLICIVVCVVLLGRFCYLAVKHQMDRGILKKVKLKSNSFDIELFDEEDASYFDKYLNEVLYLFENANVDVIVFEDMDRFDSSHIFEKLREINTLLNRKTSDSQHKKPLRFFYLLKDDMFCSKERTKFFDLIVPVVPIVDGSNSLDIFMSYFEQSGIIELFDMDFVKGLSLYVDDMRVLKNICNEFLIYYEKLQKNLEVANPNKLLAMITYKNIFPRDFVRLQVSEGYVYNLIRNKEEYIKTETARIQSEIAKIEAEEKRANEECTHNLDELDALYYVDDRVIRVDSKRESQFPGREEFVAAIKRNNYNVSIGTPYYSRYEWSAGNVKEQFDILLKNQEYLERKTVIEGKSKTEKGRRQYQINKLRAELEQVSSAYLKDLINKENADEIFESPIQKSPKGDEEFIDVKRNTYFPLIKFLIRNGYIDEFYPDYMTLFYEKSISGQDRLFLRSITDAKAKPYDYPLRDVELVISRMRQVDFETEECWNYQLLDKLLDDLGEYQKQRKRFLQSLWNYEPVEFVEGYICRGENLFSFVGEFNRSWTRAVTWILEGKFSETAVKVYILETLYSAKDEELITYNEERIITKYISLNPDFLQIQNENVGKVEIGQLLHAMEVLNVEFREIHAETAHPDLLQGVYKKELYEINESMIDLFLERMYHIDPSEEYRTKKLTLILSQEQPLAEYVKANLEMFLRIQLASGEELNESEDTLVFVLNADDVDNQCKKEYLECMCTKLPEIQKVQDHSLWSDLIDGHVIDSQENLCEYFYHSGNGLDDALVEYINNYRESLALVTVGLDTCYGKGSKQALFRAALKCNDIEDNRYREMLKSFYWHTQDLACTELTDEKIDILIQNHIIGMSLENLHLLRDNYESFVATFIRRNVDDYLELMTAEEFNEEEAVYVLELGIADEKKINLLSLNTNPMSVMHKGYSSAVICHILQNNLDEEEQEQLYKWYPDDMPNVQKEIMRIAVENLEEIIMEKLSLRTTLLDDILNRQDIVLADRVQLLANVAIELSIEEVQGYLRLLHLDDYEKLWEGKRPKFEITDANTALLEAFEKREWISQFYPDENSVGFYRAIGRKIITD